MNRSSLGVLEHRAVNGKFCFQKSVFSPPMAPSTDTNFTISFLKLSSPFSVMFNGHEYSVVQRRGSVLYKRDNCSDPFFCIIWVGVCPIKYLSDLVRCGWS